MAGCMHVGGAAGTGPARHTPVTTAALLAWAHMPLPALHRSLCALHREVPLYTTVERENLMDYCTVEGDGSKVPGCSVYEVLKKSLDEVRCCACCASSPAVLLYASRCIIYMIS